MSLFQVSRSGCYAFLGRHEHPASDAKLAEIIDVKQENSFHTYGYRRIWLALKQDGIVRNPKTILQILEKYNLLSEIRRRRERKSGVTSVTPLSENTLFTFFEFYGFAATEHFIARDFLFILFCQNNVVHVMHTARIYCTYSI